MTDEARRSVDNWCLRCIIAEAAVLLISMSGLYNRLTRTPSSSESGRRKRQPLQDQESSDPSEAEDLLPDDVELKFEPLVLS